MVGTITPLSSVRLDKTALFRKITLPEFRWRFDYAFARMPGMGRPQAIGQISNAGLAATMHVRGSAAIEPTCAEAAIQKRYAR
jgi:hypothetical protein